VRFNPWRPTAENPWDPKQPRDASGRWRESGAVSASRAAFKASQGLVGREANSIEHNHAARAHRTAAEGHKELAAKHRDLGNAHAARKFQALSEEHTESAEYHESRIKRPPSHPVDRLAHTERGPRVRKASSARIEGGYRAAETKRERDDFAEQNISPDFLPLWNRTKGSYRGTPHERFERFTAYAEAHPHEVAEAWQDESEKKLGELVDSYETTYEAREARANPGGREMATRRRSNPECGDTPPAPNEIETLSRELAAAHRKYADWLTSAESRDATPEELARAYAPLRAAAIRSGDAREKMWALEGVGHLTADLSAPGIGLVPREEVVAIEVMNPAQTPEIRRLTAEWKSRQADEQQEIRRVERWDREHPKATHAEKLRAREGLNRATEATYVADDRLREAEERAKDDPCRQNPGRRRNPPPSYREAHWGIGAKRSDVFDVGNPKDNRTLIALGELVAVTYGTVKGGDGNRMTDYVHTFERKRPMLCYGSKDGLLYVAGGDYTVQKRGIVG
jgi:hypothetical protein